MALVLVADDEHAICEAFAAILTREGHTPLIASSGAEAVSAVAEHQPSVVFMDVQMPNMTGLEALEAIQASTPGLPVILMTARGNVQIAMEAMAKGAFDYLGKPLELEQIRQLLERALHASDQLVTVDEVAALGGAENQPLGTGPRMQQVFKMVGLLASNDMTVLIVGESGSGKELIARAIHDHGSRGSKPFVAVNCAAIPDQLIESELFGHEKGAFTGAVQKRRGRFEAAEDGTLFLDEISELPYHLQGKLLRVLQEKAFERVGGETLLPLRARVIAASNRQLGSPDAERPFREDLYHRLNLVRLELPPLRDRKEDIALLALHFLAIANRELGKQLAGIEDAAVERLAAHSWPGNVRELEHTIKRSVLLAQGNELTAHDLVLDHEGRPGSHGSDPAEVLRTSARRWLNELHGQAADAAPFQRIIEETERELVLEALALTGGNQVAAARLLGINRTTLRKKLSSSQEVPDDGAAD